MMVRVKDDGLSSLSVSRLASEEEAPAESPSRPTPRTPPRVWPPVSPADMGRVVRRLNRTAERVRDLEPMGTLLERAVG